MVDLKAMIAKAKSADVSGQTVTVAVGDELVDISFAPVPGHVWVDLVAKCPPREGAARDKNVGYNTDAVARVYPVDRITVSAEPVDPGTWGDLLDVLPSPSLSLIAAALWGLNQYEPQQRIAELGKAKAGGSTRKRR
jgi:hypothetical protein